MAVRSVTVRYTASVGALVQDLNRAAKANDQLAKSSENAGKGLDTMSKTGLAIGLGLGVAVAKFAEFDAAMSRAAAGTGATGGELNKLRDAAIAAGQATQFSATDAANAITELGKAGVGAQDILSGGLTGALNLAAAGQLDVADAAEIAATALKEFNLQGSETSHVADLLAAGAGKAVGSVGDMALALKQAGVVAHGMGLSIEETVGGLTAFASAGLIGSDAGTSFKSMLQRLTPQSDQAAELMKTLGINAFTAGGSFKGLEQFAGNLRQSLQDLTPEQRNAALATIFGSDAVRAANILYEQGADGIRKYINAVNDQGFAQRQARALTDNLLGDIERLGGAFETNLIKAGSGANDTLRTLTQTAENLLNVVGEIPGPVITGAAAFGALALLGPKIGGLAKTIAGPLTGAITRFREEAALQQALAPKIAAGFDEFGNAAEKGAGKFQRAAGLATAASRSLKLGASGALSVLGGPWGIALGAATVAVTAFATAQSNAQQAGQEFADTLDQQTGALTDASRAFVSKKLTGDLAPADIKLLQQYGISIGDVGQKILDGGPAVQDYIQHLRDMAESGQGPTQVLSALASSVENTSNDVERGRAQLAAFNGVMDGTAGSASAADRNLDNWKGTAETAGTSASTAAGGVGELDSGLGDIQTSAADAATEMQNLIDAFDTLGGGTRAVRAAQRGLAEDLKALTEAGKQDAKGTKTKAELAAEYQAAVDKVGESTNNLISQQAKEGASVGTLKNIYDTNRDAVEKSLKAHGFHGKALEAEADKILGTRDDFNLLLLSYAKNPETLATQITTPGLEDSKTAVEGYWEVINGVPTFIETKVTTPGVDEAGNALHGYWEVINGVPRFIETKADADTKPAIGKMSEINGVLTTYDGRVVTATVRTNYVATGVGPNAIPNPFFRKPILQAAGGPVRGPGTGTSDSIPAMLSNDEHVITAAEVQAAGGHGAIYRMRKAILSGDARFAHGGAVDLLGAHTGGSARRRASMRGGVPAYRYGGPVRGMGGTWSGGAWGGIDYARLTKSVISAAQSLKHPEFHFVSGDDAQVAARTGIREFYYQRDHG